MAQQNKELKRSRNTNGTSKNQRNKSKGKNEIKKAVAEINETAIYGKITPDQNEKSKKSKKAGSKKSEKSKK
ncbi:MAG: hypothetical protein II286_00580 [Clostridia bacterium]|nr:hypothetical protein [Clostridia bacterium]